MRRRVPAGRWIAAELRRRFGVLEVISTIMLNFVALSITGWLVRGPLQEPTRIYPQSPTLPLSQQLPMLLPGSRVHVGLVVAVLLAVGLWWWLRDSASGFRLRAVGANPMAAASAGQIAVSRTALLAFLLSGALAGLAGSVELTGVTYALYENFSPGYGYTAIAVALLARLNPLAVLGAALHVRRARGGGQCHAARCRRAECRGLGGGGSADPARRGGGPSAIAHGLARRGERMIEPLLAAGPDAVSGFLEATVRYATPLALAALGECVSERAGVINIGLEGAIIAGALGGTIAAGVAGPAAGFAVGALAGVVIAGLFAVFTVWMRADQIITGTAMTMLALGLTGTLYRTVYGAGGVALSTPTVGVLAIPGLSSLPVIGRALFAQPVVTYALYLLAPAIAWWMSRTHAGLATRAMGESPEAAIAAGIRPRLVQAGAVLFAGAMAGLAGATLVLAQAGTFAEGMSAGRGFIAIAIVVLGRWNPLGVAAAALLFGAASALQTLFQAMGWQEVPYQLFLAVPYVLTLVVLAVARGRGSAPAALGRREL